MDNFFTNYYLLGLFHGNLPPHQGMRDKRYKSVAKITDILDVVRRVKPQFPEHILHLDPMADEWDDDMQYITVDYAKFMKMGIRAGLICAFITFNYNMCFLNKSMTFFTKINALFTFLYSNFAFLYYRQQMLKANLFDEYVQMKADEYIKKNEHMLRSDEVKKYIWQMEDFKETLSLCDRQSYSNQATDFADAELILQDLIRRYSDETSTRPLKTGTHIIGPEV
jgi:hypothetical protein